MVYASLYVYIHIYTQYNIYIYIYQLLHSVIYDQGLSSSHDFETEFNLKIKFT